MFACKTQSNKIFEIWITCLHGFKSYNETNGTNNFEFLTQALLNYYLEK